VGVTSSPVTGAFASGQHDGRDAHARGTAFFGAKDCYLQSTLVVPATRVFCCWAFHIPSGKEQAAHTARVDAMAEPVSRHGFCKAIGCGMELWM
jgi:hypothetical protein